jgi:L-fuconolactonase
MSFSRRDFIQYGLSGLAGNAALSQAASALAADEREPSIPIVDTHTHFYDPSRPQGVPWPSKEDRILYRTVLPREFETLTKPLGVVGTVIVEASSWVEDNQWLLDLAASNPIVLGIVGNLAPGTEMFPRLLEQFAKNPLYRGIRIGSDAVKQGLEQPEFLADLRRLIDANLELDINGGPETLSLVDQLASRLPQLRIVINHLANLRIDGKEPPAEWKKGLTSASRHKKVFLKVSALGESARTEGQKTPEDSAYYRPVLKAAWDAFGDDRVIYGSDWPVSDTAGPYQLGLKIVSDFLRDRGLAAKEMFFAQNAKVAYAWPDRK